MQDYNFWQDFFDTYQSLPDWIKALWLIIPPAFILGLAALVMRLRIDGKQADPRFTGGLVYSIYRDNEDQCHILSHGAQTDGQPTWFPLDPPTRREPQSPARTRNKVLYGLLYDQ